MTPRERKLRIENHPDRWGGDHSRMDKVFEALKIRRSTMREVLHCSECGVTISRGSRCMIHARMKKPALIAALLMSAIWSHGQLTPAQSLASVAAPVQPNGSKGSVHLYWTPSTDTNVTGYSVSYGTNANVLNQSVGVGMKTNVTLRGLLESQQYWFELVALNGISSQPPNKTNVFIQPRIEMETYVRRYSARLAAGRTNIIQASSNLVTWANILTNTAGGNVTWFRTNQTAEFYRINP